MKGKNMALGGGGRNGTSSEVGMMLWEHRAGVPNPELDIQRRFQEGNDSEAEA